MASAEVAKRSALDDAEMSNAPDVTDAMQLDERAADEDADQDLYTRLKSLQRQHEFLDIQVIAQQPAEHGQRTCPAQATSVVWSASCGARPAVLLIHRRSTSRRSSRI